MSFTDKDMVGLISVDAMVGRSAADLQRACRPYCFGASASGQIQRIASVFTLTRAGKRALLGQVR
jgi:hypothetical protein